MAEEELELQEVAPSEWKPELDWEPPRDESLVQGLGRRLSLRGGMLPGVILAFLLTSASPIGLTWLKREGQSVSHDESKGGVIVGEKWDWEDLLSSYLQHGLLSGAGGVVLAILLIAFLRTYPKETPYREYPHMLTGGYFGVLLSVINLPAWAPFVALALRGDKFWLTRLLVLFTTNGALIGAWVGWMAYRENHPERSVIPDFSFGDLLYIFGSLFLIAVLFIPYHSWLPFHSWLK